MDIFSKGNLEMKFYLFSFNLRYTSFLCPSVMIRIFFPFQSRTKLYFPIKLHKLMPSNNFQKTLEIHPISLFYFLLLLHFPYLNSQEPLLLIEIFRTLHHLFYIFFSYSSREIIFPSSISFLPLARLSINSLSKIMLIVSSISSTFAFNFSTSSSFTCIGMIYTLCDPI